MPRRLPFLAAMSFVALLAGCATQQTLAIRVLKPAPVDLGSHDLVAIDRLAGNGSEELTQELCTALRAARNPLTGKADFEVIDRPDVDRLLDDLRRRQGSASNQDAMQLLQRWKDADVLIRGSVEDHSVQEEVTMHKAVDPRTGRHMRVFTRTAQARVRVLLEIVEGAGERILDQAVFEDRPTASTTAVDVEPELIDHAKLLARGRYVVTQRYMERLLPHEATVSVALMIDDDLPELQAGNGFGRTGDWGEAARSYEAAAQRANGDLAEVRWKALHNLGVAQLFTNRFDEARRSLKDAYNLRQEETILRTLNLVSQRESELQQLQQQSRAAAPQR